MQAVSPILIPSYLWNSRMTFGRPDDTQVCDANLHPEVEVSSESSIGFFFRHSRIDAFPRPVSEFAGTRIEPPELELV